MDESHIIVDREQLKIERKIRKKLKKEREREENKHKYEQAALLKLQSTDHRIQIIKENPLKSKPIVQCTCVNLENNIEHFPTLNLNVKQKKIKTKHNHCENCPLNSSTIPAYLNKKTNALITVNIVEAIENIKKSTVTNKINTKKPNENRVLSGNVLDSDNPERKHGKIREYKKPHLSKLKKQIFKEKSCMNITQNENNKVNKLCNNVITPELNSYVERLLKDIADFYYRQFNDSMKTVHKKRFIVGFHEIEKYIPTKNVKLLIIASNLQPFDVLYEKVNKFIDLATNHNIPYVFALSRRHMSRCLRKQTPVSCIAVLNYFGSEDNFYKIIELSSQLKMDYESLSLSVNDKPKCEMINQKVIETLINKIEKNDLI